MQSFLASKIFTESKLFLALLLTSTGLLTFSLSQEAAVDVPTIAASEVEKLLALDGKIVSVTGLISQTGKSGSGHNFLNFKDSKFVAFVPSSSVAAFTEGVPAEVFKDKFVTVTGPIEIYQDKPEIVVKTPDQIVLSTPPREADDAAPSKDVAADDSKPAREAKTTTDPDQSVDWRKYFGE